MIELSSFGSFSFLEALALWVLCRMDRIFLGTQVDTGTLGLYTASMTFALLSSELLSAVFASDALYSAYSRLSSRLEELRKLLATNMQLFALFLFPVCIGISCTIHLAVPLFLPTAWAPLSPLIAIFIISPGLTAILQPCSKALRATGQPHIFGKLYFYITAPALLIMYVAAHESFGTFVWTASVLRLAIMLPLFPAACFHLNIGIRTLLIPLVNPLIASLCMGLGIFLIQSSFPSGMPLWSQLLISIIAGAIIYTAILALTDASLLKRGWTIAIRSLSEADSLL